MKEITFVHPVSKITRTIKLCETQKELINVIRERRSFNDGSIFVLYNDGSYFFQLLGSDGHKAGHFKRCGIKAATVSSFSGELFVFGDFAITPDGCVCIGEENIKKYGSYSGQYDVNPEKVETNTDGFFSRKVNSYNSKTGDFDIFVEPSYYYKDCPYDYNVITAEPEAAIRFALYLLGR